MIRRLLLLVPFAVLGVAAAATAQSAAIAPPAAASVSAADLAKAIDTLGSFDLPVRTEASRTVRRADPKIAVPALTAAARGHANGYVRYRALVLLAGFDDASAAAVIHEVVTDPNDRLRMVAYTWFEHHQDSAIVPVLVDALGREQSEFVRPALLRALAAHGDDPRARAAALPLIVRGQDDFRGALIDALGDYRAGYALAPIEEVAKLDGPLQDEAAMALGKIGDPAAHDELADLQRTAPRPVQPSIAAALTLLGANAEANTEFLKKSLAFGASSAGNQPLVRGAAHALAVLAVHDKPAALSTLLDVGVTASDAARAPVALAVGLVAFRRPDVLLHVIEERPDRAAVLQLLQEAFDMLSPEDYELERFYVYVRHEYWGAAQSSPRRALADALIRKLEF